MKNIDILMELKKQLNAANFIMDDIEVEIETDDVELDELISEEDELIYELFETINDINQMLNMLTVDLRQAMSDEIKANTDEKNFECETYGTWCEMISHEPMKMVGLIDSFAAVHNGMLDFIAETIRGFRILTQDGYGTQE